MVKTSLGLSKMKRKSNGSATSPAISTASTSIPTSTLTSSTSTSSTISAAAEPTVSQRVATPPTPMSTSPVSPVPVPAPHCEQQPSTISIELDQDSQVLYPDETDELDEEHTVDEESQSQTQKVRRKKAEPIRLSDENEKKIASFLEQNPFIYDKGSREYKDKEKSKKWFHDMGQQLDPPISGSDLRTWWYSIRSRFGRLTYTKSGQATPKRRLTDRERWILEIFQFLKPHIVRHRKTSQLGIETQAEVLSLVTSEEEDEGAMEPPKLKKTRSDNSSTESSKQRKLNQRRGVIDDIIGDGPTPGQAIDGFIRECTRIWRPQEKTQPKVPHWQMQIKSFCDMIEHQLSDDQVDKRFLPDMFMEVSAAISRFTKIQGDCVPSHLMHHMMNKYSVQPTTTALNTTTQALGPTTTQSAFGVVPPNLQAPLPVCHPPPHTQPPLTAAQVNQVINALGGGVRPLGSGTISPGFGDMNMSFSSLPSNPSLSAFLDTATPRNSPSRAPSRSSQSSSLTPLNE